MLPTCKILSIQNKISMEKNKIGMYIWYGEILSLCLISCNIAKCSFKYKIYIFVLENAYTSF